MAKEAAFEGRTSEKGNSFGSYHNRSGRKRKVHKVTRAWVSTLGGLRGSRNLRWDLRERNLHVKYDPKRKS